MLLLYLGEVATWDIIMRCLTCRGVDFDFWKLARIYINRFFIIVVVSWGSKLQQGELMHLIWACEAVCTYSC